MEADDFKTVKEWYEFWNKQPANEWDILDWDGFYGMEKDQFITYNEFLRRLQECTMVMRRE